MLLILLSANGTLRTILILVVVYLVLRMLFRSKQGGGPGGGARWSQEPPRPPGDVRIERPAENKGRRQEGHIQDADYEEIK